MRSDLLARRKTRSSCHVITGATLAAALDEEKSTSSRVRLNILASLFAT